MSEHERGDERGEPTATGDAPTGPADREAVEPNGEAPSFGDDPDPFSRGEGRSAAAMIPVLLAPLGIAIAIVLSLAVKAWAVSHSVIIQVEQQWVVGERLGARVLFVDGARAGIDGTAATLSVVPDAGGAPLELTTLAEPGAAGLVQGRFDVPPLPPGPATLAVELAAPGRAPLTESIEIEIVEGRASRAGAHTISTSQLNWGDDTQPQPDNARINVRPFGRLLAGFDNTMLIRATDLEGRPHAGELEVVLTDGEFMGERASSESPPVLFRGRGGALGLVSLTGPFTSEVLGLEVRLFAVEGEADAEEDGEGDSSEAASSRDGKDAKNAAKKDAKKDAKKAAKKAAKRGAKKDQQPTSAGDVDEGEEAAAAAAERVEKPIATRRVRMVSFSGAVRVYVEPLAVELGSPIQVGARPLRAKRPIFVDIHDRDGSWVDTLNPPLVGREPPREWLTAGLAAGLRQAEAYHYFNAPGESAAVALFQLTAREPSDPATLEPLIALQRERLDVPRVEKDFDVALERKHLDIIASAAKTADDVERARRWLIGTLPVHVLNPSAALSTRAREEATIRAAKRRWNTGILWFLIVGGGGFLLLATLLILRSHGRMARETTRALFGDDDDCTQEELVAIRRAQQAVLARGGALILSMGLGLVLAIVVLNKIVWEF